MDILILTLLLQLFNLSILINFGYLEEEIRLHRKNNGIVNISTHPELFKASNESMLDKYNKFLGYISTKDALVKIPKDLSRIFTVETALNREMN